MHDIPYGVIVCSCHLTVTRMMPLVEQELLTLVEHLISPDFQWCSCCSIFSFLCSILQIFFSPFFFGSLFVCPSTIYGFRLPLWYVPTFRRKVRVFPQYSAFKNFATRKILYNTCTFLYYSQRYSETCAVIGFSHFRTTMTI